MFPVSVCLRIESKRFVEEETQRKRLGSPAGRIRLPDLPFSGGATKMVALLPMNERYLRWYSPWLSREFDAYENLIVHDVFDFARREYGCHRVAFCGASLGAYHAANIAFRHPDAVSLLISLSGSFDISSFFDGYRDDNIYFNSPFEYLPNMPDPWKYNHMGIILGTGEWDNTRDESYRLSGILNSKGINHWLDDGKWRGHDWNYWRDMLPYYLSVL